MSASQLVFAPISTSERSRKFAFRAVSTAFFVLLTFFFAACPSASRAQDDDLFGDLSNEAAAPATPAPAADGAAIGETGEIASDGESTETDVTSRGDNYLVWMFRSLGWFFTVVFSFLSLTMVALVVMNIVALRRSVVVPEELSVKFGAALDENKYQDAYQLAKNDESLLGKVLAIGLARIPDGFEKATQAMRDVEQEETMRLEHRLGYLALIGNLAPMIGLFGTVVGMIESFQAIASGGAAPSPQKLAEGIATALFTTEIGLAIALPALAAFDVLKNRLARFILDVAVVSDNFMGRFSNVVPAPKPNGR